MQIYLLFLIITLDNKEIEHSDVEILAGDRFFDSQSLTPIRHRRVSNYKQMHVVQSMKAAG